MPKTLTDAEIAERLAVEIMGWHKAVGEILHFENHDQHHIAWYDSTGTCVEWHPRLWTPLTNIAQAMMVVGKLGPDWTVNLRRKQAEPAVWEACFSKRQGREWVDYEAYADTPARAICLAVLSTLDKETPNAP